MKLGSLFAFALVSSLLGCMSFHSVEATPDGVMEMVLPGDTVRLTTISGDELELFVWLITQDEIRGRIKLRGRSKGDNIGEEVRVSLNRIAAIEVGRLDFKKTVLWTVIPTVVGMAIICARKGCDTSAALTVTY